MERTHLNLIVHGASWCPDALRAKKLLEEHQIAYDWHDIDQEPASKAFVEKTNAGKVVIPVIVFPDGSLLVEPSNAQLEEKIGQYQK
jgi:glutaredoxin